jgi:polyisoprenyl-teichoic acid--peptidoglycan teichoic acid transferase
MTFFSHRPSSKRVKAKSYKKRRFKAIFIIIIIFLVIGGYFGIKTGYILSKISQSKSPFLASLLRSIPGLGGSSLQGEQEGRINVLLIGQRGASDPAGGLLADSVIVLSLNTKDNEVALISIPRDLYVKVPGTNDHGKLNSVYAYWEGGGRNQGIPKMEEMIGGISGLKINYTIVINHAGFQQLIDTVGGIDITLKKSFHETKQFVDGNECGGVFTLPAGLNHLNGQKALCYARARDETSDFDRSKRQQVILKTLKDKMLSLGTLTDFGKVNSILNAIGNNVKTDLAPDEMKTLYDKYSSMKDAPIVQRVFEDSDQGLLTVPNIPGAGYVLVPRAGEDNYSQLQDACQNIFTEQDQKDTAPVVQGGAPAPSAGSPTQTPAKTNGSSATNAKK